MSDEQHGKRKTTDTALGGERQTREDDRAGQRADTDAALGSERGYTDAERMERSDTNIAAWRTEHADDDLNGATSHQFALPPWLNLAMVVLVIAWMAVVTSQVIISTGRIAEINKRQIEAVKLQNDQQLCVQADIVGAVRKIGLKLGLPVEDIVPPDVTGLEC